ncbi:MAG: uracil-DNA glycosylase [Calditrichaeota bacterium]|nr:uracil-DNA glycosylase [Calditrichota bacterium]RQW02310.1 MAG: uracil-DNA glycosylase [Calditrichota bacterium]
MNLCKWYYSCPIKEFTDAGKLERDWIEQYCLVSNKNCVRYHLEEDGEYHPDNMLPDGEIREELQ